MVLQHHAHRGSPTQAYHREHYGANFNYYDFAPVFNREIQKWKPEKWAKISAQSGARYVVLTSKHHEGFTLWPSSIPNPTLPADRQHASRDIVGELAAAVAQAGDAHGAVLFRRVRLDLCAGAYHGKQPTTRR